MMEIEKRPEQKPRQFAEVRLPRQEALSKRGVPSPEELGPLKNLLGVWKARGTGWNMIALPYHEAPPPNGGFKFRLLMNQYNEELKFDFVDDGVKNRGLERLDAPGVNQFDQVVTAIDYQQKIVQIAAEDRPASQYAGEAGLAIHHEPGLWLWGHNRNAKDDHIKGDQVSEIELDIARLASVPHGNSVLALGNSACYKGMPVIPKLSGLPFGRFEDVISPSYDFKDDPYLLPYKHYIDKPYQGIFAGSSFQGFSPVDMNALLRLANDGVEIVRTTTLTVDTARKSGGITSAPFSVREADPVSMKSTFWIQELAEKEEDGTPKMRLQYSQVVMLNFFNPREDELPGPASWPHISIATLEKDPKGYELVAG